MLLIDVTFFYILTQLQIYEEDFRREKREKESLQQQLRAKQSTVSLFVVLSDDENLIAITLSLHCVWNLQCTVYRVA